MSDERPEETLDAMTTVTVEYTKTHFRELDATKSIRPDLLSPWLLKEAAEVLCYLLLSIKHSEQELSQNSGHRKIVTIFMKGDKQEALCYRPVPMTSISCKLLDR